MMGFFNFRGKKNNESKKKTGGIKKQVMQVLNPKIAAADYFADWIGASAYGQAYPV